MSIHRNLMTVCFAAVFALGLAACSSSSDDPPPDDTTMTETDPIAVEKKAIADAIAAARAAVAMVNDAATDEQVTAADTAIAAAMKAIDDATRITAGDVAMYRTQLATVTGQLTAAKSSRTMTMNLADQRKAISDAIAAAMTAVDAVMDDSEDDVVAAADAAVMAASGAVDDAGDIPASEAAAERAKVAALQTRLASAKSSRDTAMADKNAMEARRTEQLAAINMAIEAARDAVAAVNDESTQQEVDDANAAVANAKAKIAEAADVSDDVKATHTASVGTIETSLTNAVESWQTAQDANQELANQRMAISNAIDAARTAVAAVMDDSEDAVVEDATQAIADARVAIAGASDVPQEEKDANLATVTEIMAQLDTAKESRMAAMEARDKANADKAAMDQATALKLHKGLEHGLGDATNVRTGASNADGVISVTIDSATAVPLAEDKKTTVPANHGWEGKRHTAEPTGDVGTYEAFVYSNVGDPTEGDPFNEEYTLDGTTGELGIDTSDAAVAGRVASSRFDQSAGTKLFDLPTNTVRVMIPGSYHGVSGNYYCTPTDANTKCASTIAASGFTLVGGTWTFKPSTATAKVTEMEDTVYASYGWWLHKSEDGNTFTASAFATERGEVPAATGITALRGTATYMGGAAGKYALHSSTGGTNDAGHFTARATLEADFNADMVSGTIDQFMGADGMSRNWSVDLKKSGVSDGGVITGLDGTGDPMETVWTIDGTAAAAAGQWSGSLQDNGDDSVPKVATGTFHSTYSTAGRMVGAFGATKQ